MNAKQWYQRRVAITAGELAGKGDLSAPGLHSAASLLFRYTPLALLGHLTGPLRPALGLGVALIFALAIGAFVWARGSRAGDYAFLIGAIPLLAGVSSNGYLFAYPGHALLVSRFGRLHYAARLSTVLSMLLVGANIRDLWGARISDAVNGWSLVAVGGMLSLIALALARRDRLL